MLSCDGVCFSMQCVCFRRDISSPVMECVLTCSVCVLGEICPLL